MLPVKIISGFIKDYFGGIFIDALSLLMIFIIIFSGRFSFDRFLSESYRNPWLELRIWGVLFLIYHLFYFGKFKEWMSQKPKGNVLFLLVSLFLYQIYYVGNLFLYGNNNLRNGYLLDSFIFCCTIIILIFNFQKKNDFIIFCRISEFFGLLLFFFAVIGLGNPDINGLGWAPFGGVITFYRIQFFVFCCACYLFYLSKTRNELIYHAIVGAASLFATYSSLAKSAIAASFLVILYFVFWLLCNKKYRNALAFLCFIMVIFGIYLWIGGRNFVARVHRVTDLGKVSISRSVVSNSLIGDDIKNTYTNEIQFDNLNEGQRKRILAIGEIYKSSHPDFRTNLATFIRSIESIALIDDTSGRLRMWLEAYMLFKENPVIGNGVGNYFFTELSYYSKGGKESYKYPHNIFFELLASTGLIGAVLFFLSFFIMLVILQQNLRYFSSLIFVKGYLLFFLVTSMFAGDLFDFRQFWFIATAAIASHSRNLKYKTNNLL